MDKSHGDLTTIELVTGTSEQVDSLPFPNIIGMLWRISVPSVRVWSRQSSTAPYFCRKSAPNKQSTVKCTVGQLLNVQQLLSNAEYRMIPMIDNVSRSLPTAVATSLLI